MTNILELIASQFRRPDAEIPMMESREHEADELQKRYERSAPALDAEARAIINERNRRWRYTDRGH